MKKVIFLIISVALLQGMGFPQGREHHKEIREKIEQLEKIKIIETLKMDEQTTLKFFARRTEFKDKLKDLMYKENKLLDKIDDFIKSSQEKNNSKYQGLIEQYFDLDQKIFDARKSFITSLSDILSQEQIAKLLVFQRQFREEVREILFKRGGRPDEPPGH
ncbi:MAG: hypothetical protein P8Z35_04770 [Ignavibacteriaceae bacterium]